MPSCALLIGQVGVDMLDRTAITVDARSIRMPDDGSRSSDSGLRALEDRVKALEEWKADVMKVNPHLAAVLDETPRGEASDE